MQEMIHISKEGGIVFIYAGDRKLYEFHAMYSVL